MFKYFRSIHRCFYLEFTQRSISLIPSNFHLQRARADVIANRSCQGSSAVKCTEHKLNCWLLAAYLLLSPLGLPRVLEYTSATPILEYSSNILLLDCSLLSISGCKFLFLLAVFAVTWWIVGIYANLGLAISFVHFQTGNRSNIYM